MRSPPWVRCAHTGCLLPHTAGPHAWLPQSALLYTNTAGQRVIRVHTLALPVSDNISTVFKGADLDAQVGAQAAVGGRHAGPGRGARVVLGRGGHAL